MPWSAPRLGVLAVVLPVPDRHSRVPAVYSVTELGAADLGGGSAARSASAAGRTSVGDLTGPRTGAPDLAVELVARRQSFRLASGEQVDGYTVNGSSPGPALRARQGDLVEAVLVNADVEEGVTLHWHGVDLPNAEDGVAGVTQDTVPVGGRHTYRFVAEDTGTYWYHSHSSSSTQVSRGLFGSLVVEPADATAGSDLVAAVHTYAGRRTLAGRTGEHRVDAVSGSTTRVRLINTDDGPLSAWTGAGYRVLAVDGRDVVGPTPVTGRTLVLPAGGRLDVELTAPARLDVGGGTALVLGDGAEAVEQPPEELDLLSYGTPAPLPFDPDDADRRFDYDLGRRPGFLDGRPGYWWTVNGGTFPDVPRFVVDEGEVVRVTIRNDSGDVHPMHLHGHHALVLSRDGVPATGSPWWIDSLNVEDGETWELAFLADNPGVWSYHCHNLEHAVDGLVATLAYDGVDTPFEVGARSGDAVNAPE